VTERSSPPQEGPWFRVGGDEVLYLRDGEEAFPAMLKAIGAAEREVLLEFYWISPGRIGRRFRDALVERASAGVAVRVLYDSVGSRGMSDEWWRPLVFAGGLVHEYHPILPFRGSFTLSHLMQRDHRKILVVDGEIAFTGGINLGDEWLPAADGGAAWRDDGIAVRGKVALEMRALFYRTWRRVTRELAPLGARLGGRRDRLVYVLASQRRRRRSIHGEYLLRIREARRSIDLANAYFVPDFAVRHALYRAVARGVRVRVLLPEVSDVPGVQFAVEALFDRFLDRGIEIHALPPPMLHAKTAIVDGRFVTIGSYNLDERSWRRNLEANLAVVDEPFAAHVTGSFERDLARATRIDRIVWRKRSLVRRGAEWLALSLRELV
jgi:cardiolipin synthase